MAEKPGAEQTLRAMMQKPLLHRRIPAGHGDGGALAGRIARILQPKLKSLILMAVPMPPGVDIVDLDVIVVALYGRMDSVVTSETGKNPSLVCQYTASSII